MRHLRATAAAVLLILTLALMRAPAQTPATNNAVYRKALAAKTGAETSAILPNLGQTMHLITVIFPTESGAVANIQIRLEASYDNAVWFPISRDITSAPRLGGVTYQITVAYGPFPYLRVRSVHMTPTANPFDVWYSGQSRGAVSYVQQETDRFIL